MRFRAAVLASFLLGLIAVDPSSAFARAGQTYTGRTTAPVISNQGSRGDRTYAPVQGGAAPIGRTTTVPVPVQRAPVYESPRVATPVIVPYYRPSFGQRHPFWSGVAGGFTGAWVAHMMFGHGAYGYGGGGAAAFVGLAMMLVVLGVIIWGLFLLFASMFGRDEIVTVETVGYVEAPRSRQRNFAVSADDQRAFGEILTGVQSAWSDGSVDRLRHLVTPEMLSYFADELATNASRGVANKIGPVSLHQGDIRESWGEDNVDYATVFLRWSATDVMVSLEQGPGGAVRVMQGDPTNPVMSSEIWTFRRDIGGRWLLSAQQQVG